MANNIPFEIQSFVAKEYQHCPPYYFKVIVSGAVIPGYHGEEFQNPGFEFSPSMFFGCAESALEHKLFRCSTEEAGLNHLVFSPEENENYAITVTDKKRYKFNLNPAVVLPKEELAYQFLKSANQLMFALSEKEKDRLVDMLNYPGLDELYSADYIKKRFDEEKVPVFLNQTKNIFAAESAFSKS